MGGCVAGSRPVTYSPFPQCCQLISQGSSFFWYFKATAKPASGLYNPQVHWPESSASASIMAASSPPPEWEGMGAGQVLKLLAVLNMGLLGSPSRDFHAPRQTSSVPSSTKGQPKLK